MRFDFRDIFSFICHYLFLDNGNIFSIFLHDDDLVHDLQHWILYFSLWHMLKWCTKPQYLEWSKQFVRLFGVLAPAGAAGFVFDVIVEFEVCNEADNLTVASVTEPKIHWNVLFVWIKRDKYRVLRIKHSFVGLTFEFIGTIFAFHSKGGLVTCCDGFRMTSLSASSFSCSIVGPLPYAYDISAFYTHLFIASLFALKYSWFVYKITFNIIVVAKYRYSKFLITPKTFLAYLWPIADSPNAFAFSVVTGLGRPGL